MNQPTKIIFFSVLLIIGFLIFNQPKPAKAVFGAGDTVIVAKNLDPKENVETALSIKNLAQEIQERIEKFIKEKLLARIKSKLISLITERYLDLVLKNSKGLPSYIQDYAGYLEQAGLKGLTRALNRIETEGALKSSPVTKELIMKGRQQPLSWNNLDSLIDHFTEDTAASKLAKALDIALEEGYKSEQGAILEAQNKKGFVYADKQYEDCLPGFKIAPNEEWCTPEEGTNYNYSYLRQEKISTQTEDQTRTKTKIPYDIISADLLTKVTGLPIDATMLSNNENDIESVVTVVLSQLADRLLDKAENQILGSVNDFFLSSSEKSSVRQNARTDAESELRDWRTLEESLANQELSNQETAEQIHFYAITQTGTTTRPTIDLDQNESLTLNWAIEGAMPSGLSRKIIIRNLDSRDISDELTLDTKIKIKDLVILGGTQWSGTLPNSGPIIEQPRITTEYQITQGLNTIKSIKAIVSTNQDPSITNFQVTSLNKIITLTWSSQNAIYCRTVGSFAGRLLNFYLSPNGENIKTEIPKIQGVTGTIKLQCVNGDNNKNERTITIR